MKKQTIADRLSGIGKALGKYKYAVLILLLGAGLMLCPTDKKEQTLDAAQSLPETSMEEKLEELLSCIHGAGKVRVLLTMQEDAAYTYQMDEHVRTEETDRETVVLSDGSGGEGPVITGTRYPVYRGAVIVCHGAEDPAVKLSIVKAVQDLTGLGSDKISVIKMKEQ